MPNLYDLLNPELTAVIRALELPDLTLRAHFPDRERLDVNYSFLRGNARSNAAAAFRAFDAESQIGTRPGVTRVTGQLPPVSQKIPLTEYDRLQLEALRSSGDLPSEIEEQIFDDAASMTRAVQERLELARGDVLVDGIITLNENGLQFTIDYGVPAGHKVTAAVTWATASTDILGDIRTWVQTYVDTNGRPPARVITSTKVIGYMVQNTKIRELAGSILGAPTYVSRDQLSAILSAFSLPPVEPYDVQVYNVAGSKVRVIPDDRFIMLPDAGELGATQFGVTVEAMKMVESGVLERPAAPGIVALAMETFDPVQMWTKATAIALPVIQNPDLLFSADVVP
jgi:Phage major capsid protein E